MRPVGYLYRPDMNFISIRQYFNKLQIVFLALMMIPLFAFIAIYLASGADAPRPGVGYYFGIPCLAVLDWILAIVTFDKKIKSARNAQGLGKKLDKYFYITIVRYCLVSSASLILAVGFFLVRSDLFTALYLVSLFASALFWPTGPRVARELMLKGDEKEMVYFKKDTF